MIEGLLENILETTISLQPVHALLGFELNFSNCNIKKIAEANHLILLAKFCITKQKYAEGNIALHYIFNFELLLRSRHFPSLQETEL